MPLLPIAALVMMLGTAQPPDACRGMRGRMINSDGARTTIVLSDVERCLEVRIAGRVTFDDADADVRSMEPGASLVATETRDGETRALTLAERGGAIDRAYRVNGQTRAAAESADWFRAVVLDLVREGGYGARERVARIRRQGGAAAVLDETRRIRSDHVKQVYLEALLGEPGITVDDIRRTTRFAADNITSDHGKASVLRAAVDRRGDDREVAEAVVRGATTIGSDHERAELLRRMLDRAGADDGLLARALDAAGDIGSDHERANVLHTALQRGEPDAPAVRTSFFRALDAIGSDHERGRVLQSIATREALGGETVRAVLASAARIGSDHEKAAVLLAVGTRPEWLRDSASRAAFDAALKSIGSDTEYRRVASIFAR